MKRLSLVTVFLFSTLSTIDLVPANAQLVEAWTHWQYFRPISLPRVAEPRLVRVTLAMEIYGLAQPRLADLRVVQEDGTEVPFVLHARVGKEERHWRQAEIADLGFIPGEHTQIVVDVGSDHDAHNSLEIQTGVNEFFAWVEVAASDDREAWRILNEKAPIYRFEDTRDGNTVVSYPDSQARWLRLKILQEERRFAVYGCRVVYELVEAPELLGLPGRLEPDPSTEPLESRWQVDLGVENVPASSVRFEADQPEFHRTVRVRASSDGEDWREVGRGEIYRYPNPEVGDGEPEQRTSTQVRFPEARGRHWCITVLNRNDVPVVGVAPILEGTPRHVVFRQQPGTTYQLLYGSSRSPVPQYDLARLTPREDLEEATFGELGPEAVNANYFSPEPWSERHPVVLWLALASRGGRAGISRPALDAIVVATFLPQRHFVIGRSLVYKPLVWSDAPSGFLAKGDVLRFLSKKNDVWFPKLKPVPVMGTEKENHTSWERYYRVSDCSSSSRNNWYLGR